MFFSDTFAPGCRRSEAMRTDQELGLGPTMAPRSRCWRRWGVARSKARAFMGGPFFAPLRFRGAKAAGDARVGVVFFFEASGDAAGIGFFRRKKGMPSAKLGFVALCWRRSLRFPNGEAPPPCFKRRPVRRFGKRDPIAFALAPEAGDRFAQRFFVFGLRGAFPPKGGDQRRARFSFFYRGEARGAPLRAGGGELSRHLPNWQTGRRRPGVPALILRAALRTAVGGSSFGCRGAPGENFEKFIFLIRAKRNSEKSNKRRAKGQAINRDRGGAQGFVFFAQMSGAGAPPFSAVWAIGAAPPAIWVAGATPWPFASGEAGGGEFPAPRARAIPPPIPFVKFFRRGVSDRRRGCETRARASAYLRAMRRWQWHAEATRLGARIAALEACPPAPFEAVGNGNFSEAMQALRGWAAACFA
ncbi:hypothetical protein, conserved in T. vivax [Trypanosoma vivax Y486]|uniref:Uncharacterized protein n=1 Tax=Trypanosoma vivax (strain Y486) TaxID=1055687 RepID=F9WM63_TRYVY|nr:hypothetical protein, conserved in T. vivax [Trypanosoma vivax Y486]|eukprot:CCD18614.1 hypothetical protein, conserved in T. vivax [Trypanosoma vivax Y486]